VVMVVVKVMELKKKEINHLVSILLDVLILKTSIFYVNVKL
jgi:hypothetical protein